MKILVIGDYISDVYTFGKATRLCPEAPVPVIVPESTKITHGGCGLVWAQMLELMNLNLLQNDCSMFVGSKSEKHRFFAGSHLVCRIDKDSINPPVFPTVYEIKWADVFVISDYGKGAMTRELARQIVDTGKPCFVDAKHHFNWYARDNCTAFPNEFEDVLSPGYGQIIFKKGARGCGMLGGPELPATVSEVVDVTGAGDIFMASFVYAWSLQLPAEDSLRFANEMAGESCRHLGTFVVGLEFAQSVLDRLRVSKQSGEQGPSSSGYSNEQVLELVDLLPVRAAKLAKTEYDILAEDSFPAATDQGAILNTLDSWQTPRQSPSVPTESIGTRAQWDQHGQNEAGNSRQTEQNIQSSTESSSQCEHKLKQDRVLHPGKS